MTTATLYPARGQTLPTGATLTLTAAGVAPGAIVAIYDATGNRSWVRVLRCWSDSGATGGGIVVEAESTVPPPPPPP